MCQDMAEPNAVERRLAKLREQYMAFAKDEAARVLHWVIREDERRMIDTFLKLEALEGKTGDILLLLDSPFEDAVRYGTDLVTEIAQMYDALREPLLAAGLAKADWRPPLRKGSGAQVGHQHLKSAAESFHEDHQPLLEHFSLVLSPAGIADGAALSAWLTEAGTVFTEPTVKLVFVDHAAARVLPDAPDDKGPIRTVPADLDMPGCMLELNAAAGLHTPQGQFRDANIKMGVAIGAQDMKAANTHGAAALKVAEAQAWPHLAISVWFTLASGYLGQKNFVESMNGFRKAELLAAKAKDGGEAWAPQLLLHSRLGAGSVAVSSQSWALGAEIYGQNALPVAQEMKDARMQIECLRMAAYCNEQLKAFPNAWDQCVKACAVGRSMTPEERNTTTLAFVGEAMLRIAKQRGFTGYEKTADQEMRTLLGDDWRSKAAAASPPHDPDPSAPSPLDTNPPQVKTIPQPT